MRNVKMSSRSAAKVLDSDVSRAIKLQLEIGTRVDELKALKAGIKKLMQDAELKRFVSRKGHEALLIERENLSWKPDKLREIMCDDEFLALCPPKPNATQLREQVEQAEEAGNKDRARELMRCASKRKSCSLELRAANKDKPKS